jgi:hypothetical protein
MTEDRVHVQHVIEPLCVYSPEAARKALGLTASTLRREVREGRLRRIKRAGRNFFLGEYLLEWLRGGEVLKRKRRESAAA